MHRAVAFCYLDFRNVLEFLENYWKLEYHEIWFSRFSKWSQHFRNYDIKRLFSRAMNFFQRFLDNFSIFNSFGKITVWFIAHEPYIMKKMGLNAWIFRTFCSFKSARIQQPTPQILIFLSNRGITPTQI